MSLLADLLAKNKSGTTQGERDIPPTLAQSYNAPAAERSMKSRYIVISIVCAVVVLVGVAVSTQFERLASLINPKPPVVPLQAVEKPKPAVPLLPAPQQPVVASTALQSVATVPPISETVAGKTEETTAKVAEPQKNRVKIKKKQQQHYKPKHRTLYGKQRVIKKGLIPPKTMDITVMPRLAPGNTPVVDAAKRDAMLYAARSAELTSDWRTALLNYRAALDFDPENFRIMNNIAAALNNLGKFDESVKEAKRALSRKPDYVPAMINAAIAYSSSGNSMEALLLFTTASAADPGNKNLAINLGILQERTGKLDEAQATYRQLADAGDPYAMMGMGRIYERKGYNNEAARIYRKIQKMPETGIALKKEIKERLMRLGE